MITLKIDNSESQISGLSEAQLKQFRKVLSYSINPQAAFFSGGFKSNIRYMIDKVGRFPTGLLYLVDQLIKQLHLIVDRKDIRRAPEPRHGIFSLSLGITPYPEQEKAALACLQSPRGIIVAPTGLGKSVIIAMMIQKLQVNTIVVVPNLSLKQQLTQSLKHWFGEDKVGDKSSKAPIVVENVDGLSTKTPLEGYDCVIIDEFHHAAANTYRTLNKRCWTKIYHRYGLTATPFRSQESEKILLESVLSEEIYRVTYETAVQKGYIVPIEAYYIEIPKSISTSSGWFGVYSELVVNNEPRNKIIADLLNNLNSLGISTLCLVKEIKHGENIQNLVDVDFIKGENTDNRIKILEFNLREKVTMIGTTGVVGEGTDTKPCEYVIIAGLGKSKNAFMQQVGRAVRVYPGKESAKVILFYDRSHKWTEAHFKAQVKILREEYGVKPVKLSITD